MDELEAALERYAQALEAYWIEVTIDTDFELVEAGGTLYTLWREKHPAPTPQEGVSDALPDSHLAGD